MASSEWHWEQGTKYAVIAEPAATSAQISRKMIMVPPGMWLEIARRDLQPREAI
jgi:hypothetical protein